jgi:H+-transporting ATPase
MSTNIFIDASDNPASDNPAFGINNTDSNIPPTTNRRVSAPARAIITNNNDDPRVRSKFSGLNEDNLIHRSVSANDVSNLTRVRRVGRPESLQGFPDHLIVSKISQQTAATDKTTKSDNKKEGFGSMSIAAAFRELNSDRKNGLTNQEAENRLKQYGPNALPEKKESKLLKFLSFMWNPLSWVMEAAAIVAIVLSNGPTPWLFNNNDPNQFTNQPPDYPDFVGIVLLLLLNSIIGYYEESVAGDAVAALMGQLTREYKAKREGKFISVTARNLVPGDIITIKLGDIIPADCKLLEGEPMKIDQSALTGESLPVTKNPGDEVYSGSTVKQGETEALVFATGVNSFLGKAASLVQSTESHGHLQAVLTQIGAFCMGYILIWVVILCGVLYGDFHFPYRRGIDQILVALIGGVPIAMPTVLSVTMAIGVNDLAKEQAVVTRITAVEELAGMDVLCSDKTGTLTKNELTVREPHIIPPFSMSDIMIVAALASRRTGDPDPIDRCIGEALVAEAHKLLDERYEVVKFVPFDPSTKRTVALVQDRQTKSRFLVSKGAPQIILQMVDITDTERTEEERVVLDYAERGFRCLGVARSDTQTLDITSNRVHWEYIGLLSLSDPPRDDTKETIHRAMELGVRVVMITGDQVAIGKETARELGMGLNFHPARVLNQQFVDGVPLVTVIEEANGWGEVMPEQKYIVVTTLRNNGHVVGMTGDGVNDAPALKAADVGIAVSDATDAARSAADMVLLTEGLSVIIKAILGSRKIFQRMRNYAIYACATTIRVVTTFGILSTAFRFSFPPFLCLVFSILNDGTIMTISTDNVEPSPVPDQWKIKEIFGMAGSLGLYLTASTVSFYYLVTQTTFFTDLFPGLLSLDIKYDQYAPIDLASFRACSLIYLQVSITGQFLIFSTRARGFFFNTRPSVFLLSAFLIAQLMATLIAVYAEWEFTQISGIGWGWAAVAWGWSGIWLLVIDIPKFITQAVIDGVYGHYPSVFRRITNMGFNGGAPHLRSAGAPSSPKRRRNNNTNTNTTTNSLGGGFGGGNGAVAIRVDAA